MKPGASALVCRYNSCDTAGREDRRGIGAFKARLRVWSRGSVSISLVTTQTSLLLSIPFRRLQFEYTPVPAVSLAKARDEQEENNNSDQSLAKSQQERGAICEKLFLPLKIEWEFLRRPR